MSAGLAIPVLFAAETLAPAAETPKLALGTIVGIVRNPAKVPVGGATITAAKVDGSGIRATISGSDGVYSFADVVPGAWSITAQADGYSDAVTASLDVVAGKAARSDVVMTMPAMISSTQPAPSAAAQPAQASSVLTPADTVWSRWSRGEKVALDEIKGAFLGPQSQTASLKTPATAFDKPAAAPAVPLPNPQAGGPAPAATEKAAPAPTIPEALQAPEATTGVDNVTPFAYGDFTWLNGTPRNKDTVLDTKFFTPEVRFDTHFMEDFNQPTDHTIVGATESFRSGEFQIEQASVGGDFHWQNVRGRILFMQGLFSTTTPRNDASSATGSNGGNTGGVGQWDLQSAYKYVSEAYGGYHFNVNHGLNVDAGIFVSYIGLFSYYNFDNWTYQPSYVSSNTPWFFNGLRIQWFPTNKLKIEPWVINGWQSYAKFNSHVGLGGQLLWMPTEKFKLVANQYGFGQDNLGLPHTERIHTDDSIEYRYYNNPNNGMGLSKMAFSLTADAGTQYGGGLCGTCGPSSGKESFVGWMLYDRLWWSHDKYAITLGGGEMSNWGRYLTLLPPIDGAWASVGSVYFPELPGQRAHMWDSTVTFQYMPREYITWWAEVGYRHSDIPYFAGRHGVTPPGGNNGLPQYYTCMTGASAMTADPTAAATACSGAGGVWYPDLRRSETKLSVGVMVKF
ncbi:MAG TPA: TonB-dependent receptor [Bryobacteraceae bacterium]|nr:TonB-dependent receptor [Bryobacteraceae bacterium]